MIVIGVDTHKRSHTLVALDAATGATRGQLTIPASDEGTLDALRFAGELDIERVWAIEDCRHVSGRLERGLVASGDRVIRVAPGLTDTSRRSVREPGKSDPIDATAIARAALREGIDRLPVAFLDEQAHEIRVLNDYRDQLVNERVRLASRLRWHLVQIAPELEAQIRPQGLIGPQIRAKVARGLARLPRSPQVRVARAILKRINEIYREEGELLAEVKALIEAHCPQLLAEHGCGTITAAIIIGHTAAPKGSRPTRASLATPALHRFPPAPATPNATACTAAATASSTAPCTSSRSPAPGPTPRPARISTADTAKAKPREKRSAASNDTSPAESGACSTRPCPSHQPLRPDPPTQSPSALRRSCHARAETRK
jgi:transposase